MHGHIFVHLELDVSLHVNMHGHGHISVYLELDVSLHVNMHGHGHISVYLELECWPTCEHAWTWTHICAP